MDKKRLAAVIKLLILCFVIIGVPILLYIFCRDTLFNREWLSGLPGYLRQYKGYSSLVLIGLQIMQVIICILPGQPIQFAASYMFGVLPGYLISITGAIIGAFISFHLAKILGSDALYLLFDEKKIEDYRNKLNSSKGLLAVLLIYLIPGIPKDLAAYAAGISNMNCRSFILMSTIGRTPAMMGSLLLGYFFERGNYAAIGVLAAVTVIILAVCLIKRKAIMNLLDDIEARDKHLTEADNG